MFRPPSATYTVVWTLKTNYLTFSRPDVITTINIIVTIIIIIVTITTSTATTISSYAVDWALKSNDQHSSGPH